MTLQEIFDRVAKHLLTQGRQARNDSGGCAYRGAGGTSCAVGCLMTDEAYAKWGPEALGVATVTVQSALHDSGIPTDTATVVLLRQLQDLHDLSPASGWYVELSNMAAKYGLVMVPA